MQLAASITINTLRPRQNGYHFADDIYKSINDASFPISPTIVPKGPVNNEPALFQMMAWHLIGDRPLSEPMMVQLTDTYMHHQALLS